jgi:hypothetical protein
LVPTSSPKEGSDAPLLKFVMVLAVIANHTPRNYVTACIWTKFSIFLLVKAVDPLFPLAKEFCQFFVSIFDHLPKLRCWGLVRSEHKASQLLLLGKTNYTPQVKIPVRGKTEAIAYGTGTSLTATNFGYI